MPAVQVGHKALSGSVATSAFQVCGTNTQCVGAKETQWLYHAYFLQISVSVQLLEIQDVQFCPPVGSWAKQFIFWLHFLAQRIGTISPAQVKLQLYDLCVTCYSDFKTPPDTHLQAFQCLVCKIYTYFNSVCCFFFKVVGKMEHTCKTVPQGGVCLFLIRKAYCVGHCCDQVRMKSETKILHSHDVYFFC